MWRVPISVGLWILRGPIRIGLAVGAQSNWAIGPWVSISIGPKPNFFSFDRSVLTFLHFDRMVSFLFSSAQLSISLHLILSSFFLSRASSLHLLFFLSHGRAAAFEEGTAASWAADCVRCRGIDLLERRRFHEHGLGVDGADGACGIDGRGG